MLSVTLPFCTGLNIRPAPICLPHLRPRPHPADRASVASFDSLLSSKGRAVNQYAVLCVATERIESYRWYS